jgi:uncharacterized SAM-dependent methyltransferase
MNLTCVPCDHGGVLLQNAESREIVDVTGNPTRPGALCYSAGGTLRTENSVKYSAQTFTAPVHRPGFTQIRQLTDARECVGLFAADA